MIDSYAWVAIVLRIISITIALTLIVHQIRLLKPPVLNQWIRYVMLGLLIFMFFNYGQALFLNFFRQGDGNLSVNARHFSQISTSLAGLASIILAALLYVKRLDK